MAGCSSWCHRGARWSKPAVQDLLRLHLEEGGQSTAASMPFASFPPCLSPCARYLCLISQSPVNGQPKALLLGYFEQLLKETELEIVPMSLPLSSSVSTLSLFFLSLCRKLGSQWLVSATSQTSLLKDGPSASDYPLLLPDSKLLPSVLRAQSWVSGSWKRLWRSSHTSYLPDGQNNGEHFETFFLLCFFTVFMCVAYACARAHVCVCAHMYASAHTDMKAGRPCRVTPYFPRQSLSLKLEPRIDNSGWKASPRNPPVSSCLSLLLTEQTHTARPSCMCALGTWPGLLMLAQQGLYPLSNLPRPGNMFVRFCLCSNWGNRKNFHFPWIFIIILFLLNINISLLLKSQTSTALWKFCSWEMGNFIKN